MPNELFDTIAADYDSWYQTELGRIADQVERALTIRLFQPSGPKILEVGCGTGQYTTWLAGRGLEVTAVDVSKEMIHRAQAKISTLDANVEWIQADITKILDTLGRYHGILSMTAFEVYSESGEGPSGSV